MASVRSHGQGGYNPLPLCGSDTHKALPLAWETEAAFTMVLQLQWKRTDCVCPDSQGWLRLCWTSISFPCPNSQGLCLNTWGHLCWKDLKRTMTTTKLIWTIYVFLPMTRAWRWWWWAGSCWWGSWLKRKGTQEFSAVVSSLTVLVVTGGPHVSVKPWEVFNNNGYKLTLKFPQEVTPFVMKKRIT